MNWITIELPTRAVPQPRHRATRGGRMYLPSSAPVRAFKAALIAAAKVRFRKPLAGPVRVEITALFRRPDSHLTSRGEPRKGAPSFPGRNLGDLDNHAKAILDALNGIAWDDDAQVVDLRVSKHWANVDLATVSISAWEPDHACER